MPGEVLADLNGRIATARDIHQEMMAAFSRIETEAVFDES